MSELITDERIAKIAERERFASPGPWLQEDKEVISEHGDIADCKYGFGPLQDADFIAHARRDIPDLLAELARLRRIEAAAKRFVYRGALSIRSRNLLGELEEALQTPAPASAQSANNEGTTP